MQLAHFSILALTLVQSLVSASLYPRDSLVKMIDTRGFRNALKENVRGTTVTYSCHGRF
jgi:protein disulfide-isomerase A6